MSKERRIVPHDRELLKVGDLTLVAQRDRSGEIIKTYQASETDKQTLGQPGTPGIKRVTAEE